MMRYKREGGNPRAGGALQGRPGRPSTGPARKASSAFTAAYLIFGAVSALPAGDYHIILVGSIAPSVAPLAHRGGPVRNFREA